MKLSWYLRRISKMSGREAIRRFRDLAVRAAWWLGDRSGQPTVVGATRQLGLASESLDVAPEATRSLVEAAEGLLEGRWEVLGSFHQSAGENPDWFIDPLSGARAPRDGYAFLINHRSGSWNSKLVWELSRHQHLTVLAAAYHLTGDARFAVRVEDHLRSWWTQNPFLSGIHWTSGLELGVRLVSWAWIRRLMDAWPGIDLLFEQNPVFRLQLHRHQLYLAKLPSHGSSANNHLIGEAAGQFVASATFPLFDQSEGWRADAADTLRREAVRQTFPSGWNRELATGYHGFVLELLLAAACEGEASGHTLGPELWDVIVRMTDALAATIDVRRNPPRQGDDDGGMGLLLDSPDFSRWQSLLATGARLFGPASWWPKVAEADARTSYLAALLPGPVSVATVRPHSRTAHFADTGITLLRSNMDHSDEIWVRCDAGPHGFGSLAGHAHADALSVEIRHGGVEIAADPGTYSYQADSPWRDYFRSTIAHNALELDGRDQSSAGGAFLWTEHAQADTIAISGLDRGESCEWLGHHDGYGVDHRRHVILDRSAATVTIEDEVDSVSTHSARLAYHLGPQVECRLDGTVAHLRWQGEEGERRARLDLPELDWKAYRGSGDPLFGWYSKDYGSLEPATTLVGSGGVTGGGGLTTVLTFHEEEAGQ